MLASALSNEQDARTTYEFFNNWNATIAAKFNNYRFADYKEEVIDLLQRVCTVSVKTMEIIKGMG